jgi:hypothetical protein
MCQHANRTIHASAWPTKEKKSKNLMLETCVAQPRVCKKRKETSPNKTVKLLFIILNIDYGMLGFVC